MFRNCVTCVDDWEFVTTHGRDLSTLIVQNYPGVGGVCHCLLIRGFKYRSCDKFHCFLPVCACSFCTSRTRTHVHWSGCSLSMMTLGRYFNKGKLWTIPFFNKSIPLLLVLLTTLCVFFKRSFIINGPTLFFFFLANRSQRHVWLPRTKLKCRSYRNSFKRSHCFSGRQCEGVGRNTSVIVMFIGCPWPFHSTRRRSEGKQFISKQIMRRISRNRPRTE